MPTIEISAQLYDALMSYFANQPATKETWKIYSELLKLTSKR